MVKEEVPKFRVLHAKLRQDKGGSKASRALRQKNLIPGIIYGPDWPRSTANAKKLSIVLDEHDLKNEERERHLALENTLYEVNLDDGQKIKAIIRQYQICALTEQPLNVNFLRYRPGTQIRIPVRFINEDASVDIRRGASVVVIQRFIDVACNLEDEVPRAITVDLTGARNGDTIKLSGVSLPEGVVPLLGRAGDIVIAKIEK
eukprot:CAMPEP_0185030140 /NCGR_PEP_ID=MMETSP1103-20130426/16926_1 /TAXON_ID=36769 /ORGANISM="Paraphysomonas bandaiensis, Strain Caron Lab Isolate" /LENGTH=202 /DNA_ID=CAMNT_0027565137 /DNA_START=226 /DNA_END=834 /DNA_ORIENTATION=+